MGFSKQEHKRAFLLEVSCGAGTQNHSVVVCKNADEADEAAWQEALGNAESYGVYREEEGFYSEEDLDQDEEIDIESFIVLEIITKEDLEEADGFSSCGGWGEELSKSGFKLS